MRRLGDALLLAIALAAGAFLRFRNLAGTSLWLDEILDYDIATRLAASPTWRWWSVSREHGPLFFATELAGRAADSLELAARIPPAALGVAAIVVAWFVAKRFGTAAVFGLLLATSPLHVYYSREARPYALLELLAMVLVGALLSARSIALTLALLLAATFTSATAAPLLVAALLAALLARAMETDADRRRYFLRTAIAAAACLGLIALLYRGNPAAAPGVPAFSLDRLLQAFSMSALDSTPPRAAAYAIALAAIIGSVVAIRRDRVRGAIVVAMAVLPVISALAALFAMRHWYSVRYVAVALPAYLLLASIGIVASARLARHEVAAFAIAVVIAAALGREAWPAALAEPLRKLDWRVVAATIREHARDGDLVIAMNDWSYVSLEFYLRGKGLRIIDVREATEGATLLVSRNTPAWIVSAETTRGDTHAWTCRYPVVLASPLESFRLHYAPGFAHLLQHRATAADLRAFAARFGDSLSLGFGPESDLFLIGGFGDPEGNGSDYARWVIGTHASLLLPSDATLDRRITLRALPLLHAGPPQRATVRLNGETLTQFELAKEWRDYTIDVPRARWRSGVNELTLTFAWAAVPGPHDPRPLSAMLDHLSIGAVTEPLPKELTALTHINASGYLLDRPVERRSRTPLVAKNRAELTSVVARLGFDPATTLPALDRGDVRLDELAAVIAYDCGCRSDEEFVALAYAVLVDRRVDGTAAHYYLSQLRRGVPRSEIVRKIVASGMMRAKLHAVAD